MKLELMLKKLVEDYDKYNLLMVEYVQMPQKLTLTLYFNIIMMKGYNNYA